MACCKTCCQCCSLRSGAFLVGMLSLVTGVVAFMVVITDLVKWQAIRQTIIEEYKHVANLAHVVLALMALALILSFFYVFMVSLMIYGTLQGSPRLLLPYIMYNVICSAILGIYSCRQLLPTSSSDVLVVIFLSGLLSIEIYFTLVVHSLYHFLSGSDSPDTKA